MQLERFSLLCYYYYIIKYITMSSSFQIYVLYANLILKFNLLNEIFSLTAIAGIITVRLLKNLFIVVVVVNIIIMFTTLYLIILLMNSTKGINILTHISNH